MNGEPENTLSSGMLVRDFLVSDEYTDYTEIPTAGFHAIYKVKKNGRFFILKGLKPEFRDNPSYQMILRKEYEICSAISHPNIVQSYGSRLDPVVGPSIIFEYVSGQTLQNVLNDKKFRLDSIQFVHQLLDAMEYLQDYQIIHRDLKPDNILITSNAHNVKIIDFCLADQDNYDILKTIFGSNEYMAPEYQSNSGRVDSRADLYSVGKIIRKTTMLYPGVVRGCLQSSPNRRFNSASEIKIYLRRKDWIIGTLIVIIAFVLVHLLHL